MARNATEMQHRKQRGHDLLHGSQVLAMLHHQDFVRYQVLQGSDRLGEVREGYLHLVDFFKVRLSSTEYIVLGNQA